MKIRLLKAVRAHPDDTSRSFRAAAHVRGTDTPQSPATPQKPYRAPSRYYSAANRVILDRQALAPLSAAACRTGPSSWRRNRSPVTVPRASGENPGQDDPDAAGVLDLDSGPEMGTSPGSSNGPEPGRRPCPGTPWRSRPPRPRPPGRRRIRLPGASILYLGITLSDERGEGERAHCRRSARPDESHAPLGGPYRSGRSGHFKPMRSRVST